MEVCILASARWVDNTWSAVQLMLPLACRSAIAMCRHDVLITHGESAGRGASAVTRPWQDTASGQFELPTRVFPYATFTVPALGSADVG